MFGATSPEPLTTPNLSPLGMVVLALLMVLVYPIAMPLTLFLLLWEHRDRLNPPNVDDEAAAIERRKDDAVLREETVTAFSMLVRLQTTWRHAQPFPSSLPP